MKKLDPTGDSCATLCVGSDRYPYEIIFHGAKLIEACMANYLWDAIAGEFCYFTREGSHVEVFTLRKNGRFIKRGQSMAHGSPLIPGKMLYYQDPSL